MAEETKTKGTYANYAQTNQEFIRYCNLAKIPPTARQVSKFFLKRGLAYRMMLKEKEKASANV
jgi:hypothetical protein